jgi:hypothetical protein
VRTRNLLFSGLKVTVFARTSATFEG